MDLGPLVDRLGPGLLVFLIAIERAAQLVRAYLAKRSGQAAAPALECSAAAEHGQCLGRAVGLLKSLVKAHEAKGPDGVPVWYFTAKDRERLADTLEQIGRIREDLSDAAKAAAHIREHLEAHTRDEAARAARLESVLRQLGG